MNYYKMVHYDDGIVEIEDGICNSFAQLKKLILILDMNEMYGMLLRYFLFLTTENCFGRLT